ncbi:MAG: choice-of-anchor D domain-containing protein [Acidobacteria bacterium]|nr:MAG: choice-of-anchor D domain-containing protein [Acidobacteriota bacterium]
MKRNTVVCLLVFILIGLATWPSTYGRENAQVRLPAAGLQAMQTVLYGRLPLSFEANKGQVSSQTRYLARGNGFTLFLTQTDAILQLRKSIAGNQTAGLSSSEFKNAQPGAASSPGAADVVRLRLLGANHEAEITALDRLPGTTSYFLGNNPQSWHTNIPNYARLRYHQIYPGIDLAYYGRQGQLENDFMVAPGSDPKLIRLGLEGVRSARLNPSGDLVLAVRDGEVYLRRPRAYQGEGVNRRDVAVRYVLRAGNKVGFGLGAYDHAQELVIDPVLSYSTYLGGSGGDDGLGIAVDASGNAYVTGTTASANFPTTGGQTTLGGGKDIFVAKINPAGTAFLYSVFLGGGNLDKATSIAIDSSGDVYLAGYTNSTDFPTTAGAYQVSNAGNTDAFLTKLNPTGTSLVYSTYFGGSGIDYGRGVAVDASGDAFITGSTQSTNFPTVRPLQVGLDGGSDAFVAEFSPTGASLLYSTYLGGSGADEALAIALDGSGNAYVTGYTFSSNFPTQNALQSTLSGPSDAFVTEINPGTSSLVFSTYLGGSGSESGQSIKIDAVGSIYVTGNTSSNGFPVTNGASQATYGGGTDAFVTKLGPGGAPMVYSTFLGGSGLDQGNSIAVDSSGDAFVTGFTQSSDFPLTNALQRVLGITAASSCGTTPCADAFVTELGPSGNAVFSTFLGGSGTDLGQAIATDASGAAYLTGSTSSTNFPVIAGAPQSTYAGTNSSTNVFIAKVSPQDAPAAALSPQSLNFGNQVINKASNPQTVTLVNAGSAPLGITSISASGQFSQTNNCGTVVPAGGGTCTIQVTFTPTQTGSVTDQITITDNAAGSPQAITVTGGGVTSAGTLSVSQTSLTFAAQTVGQTSPPQMVQLANTGNTAINISGIDTTGDFAQTNTCGTLPTVLNVGASCSISVTFTPTSTGARTGGLTIRDDAINNPQGVSLTGTGNAVFTLSSNVRSSVVLIGTKSTTFTVTASAPSTFQGGISLACTTGTCSFNPATIYSGQSSTVTVSGLSATTANPFDFAVKGNSSGQDATVSLTIFFADFSLSQTPPSPPLRTVTAGNSTTYTVTVTPANGFNQVVLMGCANLPPQTTCTYSPPGLTLNGTNPATTVVTVQTTAQQAAYLQPPPPGGLPPWAQINFHWWIYLLTFFMIFAAFVVLSGRRVFGTAPMRLRASIAVLVMAASLSVLATACNDTYYGPRTTPVTTGTPANTYTITLVGTLGSDGSIKRITTVNLAVAP